MLSPPPLSLLLLLLLSSCLFLSPLAVSSRSFDDSLARSVFYPLAAATFRDSPVECLEKHLPGAEVLGIYSVTCDSENHTCFGFVALSQAKRAVIVSIRGSEHGAQIGQEAKESSLVKSPHGRVFEYVHRGFNLLWGAGMDAAVANALAYHTDYELWVTGHSFGGAVAPLVALTAAEAGLIPASRLLLITFGAPRTGDAAFAKILNEKVPNAFRVTHKNDIVPRLPPLIFGYRHHLTEIHYPSSMAEPASYKVCKRADDLACSTGRLLISFDDHLIYYNRNVTGWGLAGCPVN